MNSTRRGKQTTGSEAYRGSEGSHSSATDRTSQPKSFALASAPLQNKWQRWSCFWKILDAQTCSPAHVRMHAYTHKHPLAGWLQHLALPGKLVFCSQYSLRPERLPAPLAFCLHLFYIWGPHYVKFLHRVNTFNHLPAKFHVTCSDFFFFTASFISAHILLCTLNFSAFMTARYQGRF